MMVSIGTLSYGFGGGLYLLLSVLLFTAWRGRVQGGLMLTVSVLSTLWCFALAYYASSGTPGLLMLMILEALRAAAWLVFLLRLLGFGSGKNSDGRADVRWLAHAVWIALTCFGLWFAAALTVHGTQLITANSVLSVAMGFVALAVLGLVLIEQLYRNTRRELRWAIKLLCLGSGGLFAYDLFLYADAMLVKQIDITLWRARGAIHGLVVPMLVVAAARNPQWSLEVFVSRRVVFHSAALLGAGIYLIAMSFAGYYIRIYGGEWGAVAQTVFLFGALVMLVLLLASGQIRSRLRLALNKHFFRDKYEYREEWLKFTYTLSDSADDRELRENVVGGIANAMESPGGILWMRRAKSHFVPTAAAQLDLPEGCVLPIDASMIRFLSTSGWVIFLDEVNTGKQHYKNLVLPDWLGTLWRPWLVVPLIYGESLIGFIILARSAAARRLNWEDTDLLKTMGRQAATHLAMMRASEALAEARQFEAFNRLSSFVVHDLKNVAAQLSLVTANAKRHLDNPEFVADAMSTVENATARMNRMLAHLRKGKIEETATKVINIGPVMEKVVEARSADQPRPELKVVNPGLTVNADPERLATVVEHIVQNAQEATENDGEVVVSLRFDEDSVVIEIADSGCGMDADFIASRLFKPFDTTKGNAGMGIGVYESREFVESCGGELEVNSNKGLGTTFALRFPPGTEQPGGLLVMGGEH
ncbi:MAG: PEP-CTERM system histidine kinase PrsK [Gammaproteobacteria bacterium]|nr:PEP-CTERM system histidine kinase PrsK [Gammaproteobacteria bacterium]